MAGNMSPTADLIREQPPGTEPIDTKTQYSDMIGSMDAVLMQMHERVRAAYSYWAPIYQASQDDVRFAYEEQWDPVARAKRQKEDRPCINFNIIPQHINLQVGQARQNKFSVRVSQKGGLYGSLSLFGGPDGDQYTYAQILEGCIRDIELRSHAQQHYVMALQHAVEGGFGWLRVKTMIPPDNPFELEIFIEHVEDRYSVMFDHAAEQPNLSDAMWALESKQMPRREFTARWPDAQVPDHGFFAALGDSGPFNSWWAETDLVRVCEYFYKDPMKRTAIRLIHRESGHMLERYKDEIKPILDELKYFGMEILEEKEISTFKVKRLVTNGVAILEEPADWPGYSIPIVPVIGRTVSLDGRRHYVSFTRYARGPQEVLNYHVSSAVERIANSPHSQWTYDVSQIVGGEMEEMWNEDNIFKKKALPYNGSEGQSPPRRHDPPALPTAELNMAMMGSQFVMDAIGQHNANLGKSSNETSGVAIRNRQMAGSVSSYDFIDNLSHAIVSLYQILVDIIPLIYTNDRVQRIINPDDSESLVKLNETIVDEETGKKHNVASINLGRYSAAVTTGPATMTQRTAFVDTMTELGKTNPSMMQVIQDLVFRAMDVPYASQIADRLKKTLPRHMLTKKEQEEIPPPEPTPAEQAMMLQSQADIARAEADKVTIPIKAKAEVDIAKYKVREAELKVGLTVEKGVNDSEKHDREIDGVEKKAEGEAQEHEQKMETGEQGKEASKEKHAQGTEKAKEDKAHTTEAEVLKLVRKEVAALMAKQKKS